MPRKGKNIYKRKDGRWEGRYILSRDKNGKAKYGYVYAKTYSEASKLLLGASVTALSNGKPKGKDMPYGQLLSRWLEVTKLSVKESTYSQYCKQINNHIRPYLGEKRVSSIGNADIEDHIAFLLGSGQKSGGGLSSKTVNDVLTIIKSTFTYAASLGLDTSCNLRTVTVSSRAPDMRVLSREEQSSLLRVLYDNIDRYKLGVLISLYTGLRIGELCALKWENINLESAVLSVNATLQRIQAMQHGQQCEKKTKIIITSPKNSTSTRSIPIPTLLIDIAKDFRVAPDAYVLSGAPDKIVEPRVMQYRFKKYVKEAGIADANFHALRHTFATRCVECGFEIRSLSEVMGHSSVNITLNRYVHSSMALKRENMDKLDAMNISPSK